MGDIGVCTSVIRYAAARTPSHGHARTHARTLARSHALDVVVSIQPELVLCYRNAAQVLKTWNVISIVYVRGCKCACVCVHECTHMDVHAFVTNVHTILDMHTCAWAHT